MERTQIYLDSEQKALIQEIADKKGSTMAELIREAVQEYITKNKKSTTEIINQTAGLWSDRDDISDSSDYINKIRSPWNQHREGK